MNLTRTIFRIVFSIIAVALIVYVNKKTDDKARSVVEFKLEMIQKMRVDSLDSQEKAELLIDETTKFVEDSSQVKSGMNYILILLAVAVICEVAFVILLKRNPRHSR